MSGFGFGSGGFGQNQQTTGFGGFGTQNQNQNQSTGFGASTGTGFGANTNTGGSLFGGSTSGGFGTSGGGFGSSTFGQNKTGFGATATSTGGSLFGNPTATSGGFGSGGGFGGGSSGSGFGSTATGTTGGLFGQNKPAFGGGTTSLFGGGNQPSAAGGTGFGSSTTAAGSAFGSGSGTAFGQTQPCTGTGNTPFNAHVEKEPGASSGSNIYQDITAMPVYQPYSHEELRIADYTAGRKFGTAQGQPGGFGSSTFGGFGGTSTSGATGFGGSTTGGGGLFGTAAGTGGFGSTSTGTGFGSGTTGGLFGAKPAGTGLFGSTATTSAQPSGGLFGSAGATGSFGSGGTGGFGSSTTTGGGLFGQQQNKPAFGFGQSTTGTGTGFGTTTSAAGGGLFGSTTTTAPFGGASTTGTGTGFGFGQQTQQQQQPAQTGGLFGSGGFGSTAAAKPGGLFGSTTTPATGGGLFGQQPQQQQQATGGLFGNAGTQQQTGGLFGAKPAGGLFGGATTQQTGGGLFGAAQQPQQGGGLFGAPATQQPAGGLFGAKPAGTGTGLFGATTQQQPAATGGLFGGLNASQQQQPQLGSSLFSSTMQQPQMQQQPQSLTASLTGSVYGSPQLFNGLEIPTQSLGPVATPLSSSQKTRKQAIIPSYRINPNASSRLITPQKRPQGYGFSYSTYGTPGSATSNSSPLGLGNSLLASGRALNKSFSSSNLRNSFSAQDSLLVPGAFTGSARSSTGSLKRLNINRNLKVRSLFGPEEEQPDRLRKKVSFDDVNLANGSTKEVENGDTASTALIRRESPTPPAKTTTNGTPEMSEINGNKGKELAIVQEETSPSPNTSLAKENAALRLNQRDQKLGAYWMKPSKVEIEKMRNKKIKDFTVGREGGGQIVFSEADLSGVNLEDLFGKIVDIQIRRATVYPKQEEKPPPGKGLNVPSLITLENAWPRAQAGKAAVLERKGKRFEKHMERLKRAGDTEFVDYEPTTGKWTFRVQHYTTYGLDYDDDDTTVLSETMELPTPTPMKNGVYANGSAVPVSPNHSMPSPPESDVDDTFEFKKLNSSKQRALPGEFEVGQVFDIEPEDSQLDNPLDTPMSFLDERSVGSQAGDADFDGTPRSGSEPAVDQEMAGSFPLVHTTEHTTALTFPHSSFGFSTYSNAADGLFLGTPLKPEKLNFAADWTQQLQRTVSPKKQDRRALRESQAVYMRDDSVENTPMKASVGGRKITTSIDLMNSLFGQSTATKSVPAKHSVGSKAFEFPISKRVKTHDQPMDQDEQAFHGSNKPRWSAADTLLYAIPGNIPKLNKGLLLNLDEAIVGEHKDIRFAKFAELPNQIPDSVHLLKQASDVSQTDAEVEKVVYDAESIPSFSEMGNQVTDKAPVGVQEKHTWELASILFDNLGETELQNGYEGSTRMVKLSKFWKKLVRMDAENQIHRASSAEERALIWLTCGDVEEACAALLDGKNFHLATMVSQLPANDGVQETMAQQIAEWRRLESFSEFDDNIRLIYEILAGNVCQSEGYHGAGRENNIAALKLSTHLNLDWRRAFGLRLWYGNAVESIEEAVKQLAEDMQSNAEPVNPIPWFVRQKITRSWEDPSPLDREDVLWGLLKLYATSFAQVQDVKITETTLAAVLEPVNVTGNPLDARLSLELFSLLAARGVASHNSEGNENDVAATNDMLILTYAEAVASLIPDNKEALDLTIWSLMQLADPSAREQRVRSILNTHAVLLNPIDSPIKWLQSSAAASKWEFAAKALYARSIERNPTSECRWLVHAGDWAEAHDVLCSTIGPNAVIEMDDDELRGVLALLRNDENIDNAEWSRGGEIYFHYTELLDLEAQQQGKGHVSRIKELVNELGKALERIRKEGLEARTFEEKVALQLMAEKVAKVGLREDIGLEKKLVMALPLTDGVVTSTARELALGYYRRLVQADV